MGRLEFIVLPDSFLYSTIRTGMGALSVIFVVPEFTDIFGPASPSEGALSVVFAILQFTDIFWRSCGRSCVSCVSIGAASQKHRCQQHNCDKQRSNDNGVGLLLEGLLYHRGAVLPHDDLTSAAAGSHAKSLGRNVKLHTRSNISVVTPVPSG